MNSLAGSKKMGCSPQEHIESKTIGEIEAYIAGRGKTRVHQGARNLSLNISDDYGNRFLVELIQNAHDAHPSDQENGEIAIVLAPEEGPNGCLYVGNRGNCFNADNFESITNIALSSKPVNESIGNKGLGFRSVLQICHWPEIYSGPSVKGRQSFDGYSFRFASENDVAEFASGVGHSALGPEIWQNMPCWFLPVVAKARPGLVERFADDGFVSVVRMPLESPEAQLAVISQIEWLLGLETPLHLFLNRIACISIERAPGTVERLQRRSLKKWFSGTGPDTQRLEIGNDQYLLTSMDVDPAKFRAALDDSLLKKQVPANWKEWQGAARVSVAIRLNRSVEKGLLYCFLPLGDEGRAPFAGYINANFYTKMDRRTADGAITLNRFFISSSAFLCKHAVEFLIKQNWPESPAGVIDLLCWSGPHVADIKNAFQEKEGNITTAQILPILGDGSNGKWAAADDTFIWVAEPDACLSVKELVKATGAAFLLPTLSEKQRASVESFFQLWGVGFTPIAKTIADWVGAVARQMHEEKSSPERWADFYDEIAACLRFEPAALVGTQFLLSSNGTLIASQPKESRTGRRRAADIYFPPGGTLDADDEADGADPTVLPLERMPATLRRGFSFLNKDVPWRDKEGGHRPARIFLIESKLVREYDTRDVLRTLASITRGDFADSTKVSAMEWAFRLWSSGRSLADKETRAANFFLPTRAGWKSSEDAMFGAGWMTLNGKALEKLFKAVADVSSEIFSVRDNVLMAYKEWPVRVGLEEDWRRFLFASGVRDCLRPIGGENIQKESSGYWLQSSILSTSVLDKTTKTIWQQCMAPRTSRIRNPNTNYRCDFRPWVLPGQSDSLSFPDATLRRDYAYQVIKSIPYLEKEQLLFRIYRPNRHSSENNEEYWPTPLNAFLAKAPWIPVQHPGGEMRFVAPESAWVASREFEPRPPRFVDLVLPSVIRGSEEGIEWLEANVELGILDDPKYAVRAIKVYTEAASKGIDDDGDVRRFSELFSQAWNSAIGEGAAIELSWIPVCAGSKISAISLTEVKTDDESGIVYFSDENDDVKKQLLKELTEPVFDFNIANVEATWGLLNKVGPGRFRKLSEQPLEVHVDGVRFEKTLETPLLREVFGGWITDFLVCAAEHRGGSFFTRTQKSLSKLRHAAEILRFAIGRKLQISMDGKTRDLPLSAHGAVVLRDGAVTTLIVEVDDGKASLSLLARVSDQLSTALNQRELANGFDAALLRLASIHGDDPQKPEDEDIARALGVVVEDLAETRRYAQADLSSHVEFAQPLAAYLGLYESVECLKRLSDDDDLSEEIVLQTLKPIAATLGISDRELVEKLGSVSDLQELKTLFRLKLPVLNAAVRLIGGRFHIINNRDLHTRMFRAYLANHNTKIIERLREGFIDSFDRVEGLSRYVELRESSVTIEAESDWYENFDELPDEVMNEQVEKWLLSQRILTSGISNSLPMLSESRDVNGRALRDFAKRFSPVASAWVRMNPDSATEALRALWLEPNSSKLEIIQHAVANGWGEFRLLDDQKITEWLEYFGLWPNGKPISERFEDWNLTEDAIENAQKDAERDREVRRKERTEITFAGQKVSALKNDYHALMDAIKAQTTEAVGLLNIDASFRSLNDVQDHSGGGGGGRGPRSGGGVFSDSAMSDEQKGAIGFIGERWAFEWIKAFHKKRHNKDLEDNCWVSGYRNVVLGGTVGRDDFGYDFVVRLSSITYYYEVKASSGDPSFFELGPTEIAMALRYKADGDNKYRILYISNATDPKRVQVTVLDNPFSRDGERKFRAVGRGSVKYEFDVSCDK